jgi:hypothetical protein
MMTKNERCLQCGKEFPEGHFGYCRDCAAALSGVPIPDRIECATCNGTGKWPDGSVCEDCGGAGWKDTSTWP